jgi:HSP20 family molecular chaperone IbpA
MNTRITMSENNHMMVNQTSEFPQSVRRYLVSGWLAVQPSGSISPIERWPDENYAPDDLDFVCNETPRTYEIVASLNGFTAQDIHVDLRHDLVIFLLTSGAGREYYAEVPVPTHADGTAAYVDIGPNFLTVSLDKKIGRIASFSAAVRRFREDLRLVFGSGWTLGRLTD